MNNRRDRDRLDYLGRVARDIPVHTRQRWGRWQARVAASLYVKNELVAIGWNSDRSDPLQAQFSKHPESIYLHAEIDAIKAAMRRYSPEEIRDLKTTLYISRIKLGTGSSDDRTPMWGMSCPCPGCQAAIHHFHIKRTVFTLDQVRTGGQMWGEFFPGDSVDNGSQ
jgi:tRNA(Arg) A34 adenosine deaminase TadA